MTSVEQHFSSTPLEEEALFNPAFIAVLIFGAIKEYESRGSKLPMPLALPYLIAPVALHRPTREALPSRVNAQMGEWVQSHPELIVHLALHAQSLRSLVSTGICFGLRSGVLANEDGALRAGRLMRRPRGMVTSADVNSCIAASNFLGRWFALQGDAGTILAIWGLRV